MTPYSLFFPTANSQLPSFHGRRQRKNLILSDHHRFRPSFRAQNGAYKCGRTFFLQILFLPAGPGIGKFHHPVTTPFARGIPGRDGKGRHRAFRTRKEKRTRMTYNTSNRWPVVRSRKRGFSRLQATESSRNSSSFVTFAFSSIQDQPKRGKNGQYLAKNGKNGQKMAERYSLGQFGTGAIFPQYGRRRSYEKWT
jgi:hypothetical protein